MGKKKGKVTTMQISEAMRDKLAELGKIGDTFEDVIKKLYDHWKKSH
jgi:hypothetical protein